MEDQVLITLLNAGKPMKSGEITDLIGLEKKAVD